MNSYIKHIIEAFDFDSANTQKKNINAYDRLLPILEKVDKHTFCDITDEEYNILTSFVGVYKVNDRRSLKETIMSETTHVSRHNDIEGQMTLDSVGLQQTQERIKWLIDIGEIMARKYETVVTNPPYLGSSRFSTKLDTYVKDHYPDVKADLSMVMYRHKGRHYDGNTWEEYSAFPYGW